MRSAATDCDQYRVPIHVRPNSPQASASTKNVQTLQLAMRSWFLNQKGHDLQCNSYEKLQFGLNNKSREQWFASDRMQPPVRHSKGGGWWSKKTPLFRKVLFLHWFCSQKIGL